MRNIKFTDTIDANSVTSLFEYGIIRRPIDGKCIFCKNASPEPEWQRREKPDIVTRWISLNDVQEELQKVDQGFFEYIGLGRAHLLATLRNDDLSPIIAALNTYNGIFL